MSSRDPQLHPGHRYRDTEVSVEDLDDRVVVRVVGALDLASAPSLRDVVLTAGQAQRHVLVDLTEATFLDSSGLKTLLTCVRRSTAQARHCLVVCEPGAVHQVIEMTGLVETFRLQPDLPSAHAVVDANPSGPFRPGGS